MLTNSAGAEAWRLGANPGLPEWLHLSGQYRLRGEFLDNSYRPTGDGSDQVLASRLLLKAEASGERFYGGIELEDSRIWFDDAGTPLGTDDVNALEPLQIYVGWRTKNWLGDDDQIDLKVGRFTVDLDSRRFLARNGFRNTINAYTGLHGTWGGADGRTVQLFYTMPVERRPFTRPKLDDNKNEFDRDLSELRFWGAHVGGVRLSEHTTGSFYLLGLQEDDGPGYASRNRDLLTFGTRLLGQTAAWEWEIETALQFGEARETSAAQDTTDIDHRAWFLHWRLSRSLSERVKLSLRYDYASGDDVPGDSKLQRFDTLFGSRGFEYGPTGIYGALARSNIHAPAIQVDWSASDTVGVFLRYRAAWLASDRDVFVTNGLVSPTGAAGSFIGHQFDTRARWQAIPGNLTVDAGGAFLLKGEFLEAEPRVSRGNTVYAYLQATFTF